MKNRMLFIIPLLLSIVSSLYAVELSKDEVLEQAVLNNRNLEVAKLQLNQALRLTEENSLLPNITLQSGVSASASALNKNVSFVTPSIAAKIDFSISSADRYNDEENAVAVQSANLSYESTLSSIKSNTITAYWNLVAAELSKDLAELKVTDAELTYQNQELAYEGGKIDSLTLKQAELALKEAQMNLKSAEDTLNSAKANLSYLTGVTDIEIEEADLSTKTLIDLDSLLNMAENSISYKTSALEIESAKLNEKILKNTLVYPTLSFSASVGLDTSFSLNYSQSWSNNFSLSDQTSINASISIPIDHLFSTSSAAIQLDNAASAIEIQTLNTNISLEEIKNTIESSYNTILANLENQKLMEEYINIAQEQCDNLEIAYENGRASFTEVVTAKTNLYSYEISLLQLLLQFQLSLDILASLFNTNLCYIT